MAKTPEKTTQIATPRSKFEDSPVFNYINSLSPIKPVRSIHITQTFNSLNFSSPPSIFTSPHATTAHKETRFLKRNNCSDLTKVGSSLENGNKVCAGDGAVVEDVSQHFDNPAQLQENFDHEVAITEDNAEPTSDSKFVIVLPSALKYDCGSPNCHPADIETNCVSEMAGTSTSVEPFVEKELGNGSFDNEAHLEVTAEIEQRKEEAGCDWESLIGDAQDLLIFNYSEESEAFNLIQQKSVNPGTRFCTSLVTQFPQSDLYREPKLQMFPCQGHHQMECQSSLPGQTSELEDINTGGNNIGSDGLSDSLIMHASEEMDDGVAECVQDACMRVPALHRGMLRRCLDFERVARRKNSNDGSNSSSSLMLQSDEKVASEDQQLVPPKSINDSSRSDLPGIGLHLNAIAMSSKNSKKSQHCIMSPSGRPPNLLIPKSPFSSSKLGREQIQENLPAERDLVPVDDGVLPTEDASQSSAYIVGEDSNQNSPKKKKRRLDQAGECDGSCKRCNCKKSKCLKLYCECFAAGVYCIEPCSCQDCFNKPIHEDTVLATRKQIESRNPLAFAPKVIRSSDSVPDHGEDLSKTPASARHKRGCNCKKSSCLKKYCECYQGGVGCSINCRCEGCKNAFGRKDGSAIMETEAEPEEEETENGEKSGVDPMLHRNEIPNSEEQNPIPALPATPLHFSRSMVQMQFSSKFKPPRSLLPMGSSTAFYTGLNYGKPNILRSQPKFEKRGGGSEEEMPEILRGNNNSSPGSGLKTLSPNSKRVSPPNTVLGSSPSRRSGRKLILQSIPSFPSLTPQH